MPFDREGTLRNAEKLLRQGKLDSAIAEYRSVIEEQPSDWNAANTLGDLYVRANQLDKAVVEYYRIADHLANQGFLPKAVALFKKILKIKPDEERAIWELGTIAAGQGLQVDAKAAFGTLMQRRKGRGDTRGAAEAFARLCELDGADVKTRIAGARARVEIGEAKIAVERLKVAAAALEEQSKQNDALILLIEALRIDPDDAELKSRLMQVYSPRGDVESASKLARTPAQLRQVAEQLLSKSKSAEGLAALKSALALDPADIETRIRIVKMLVAEGNARGVLEIVASSPTTLDPALLWSVGEMVMHAGHIGEGTALLQQVVVADPGRRDDLVILGCSIAEKNADAGYECVELAATVAMAADEWASAAAALNEFVNRIPRHIPALMRLVEICVDGGLEATMHSAQAQLADAYLATGAGTEARVIAEDLVAREPWERANIERFRQALTLLGEKDVDSVIAERLSGQSPFTSTAAWHEPVTASESSEPSTQPEAGELQLPEGETEIDLSAFLQDLQTGESGEIDSAATEPAAPPLEAVLQVAPEDSVREPSQEVAEQHYKLAATYLERGLEEQAMGALEVAARSPRHRFMASGLLASLHTARGDRVRAIEWYERAAEASAPNLEASHELLYDLAGALEAEGESARALAVYMELQAEAGNYRDLAARLEHLTKLQMDH